MTNKMQTLPKNNMKKLREVCNFIGGGTPSKNNKRFWNGNIPWASIKDMKGKYLLQTSDFISEEGLKYSATNLALPNDIILATRINPGRPIISKIRAAINQDLKIVRPKKDINTLYLYYAFLNYEREILKLSSGTTVKGITLNLLNDIEFAIPDVLVQKKIVSRIEELFSDIDKGIEELTLAQQQLKIYRQSVLKWAFEGKLNHSTKIGTTPTFSKLGEIATMRLGKMLDKAKNIGNSHNYLGNINVRWGQFDLSNLKQMRFEEKEIREYELREGDLVICEGGEPGRCAIWSNGNLDMKIQKALHRVRVGEKITSKYLFHYIFFLAKTGQLEIYFTGTTIKHLTSAGLKNIPIPLPSIEDQQEAVHDLEGRLSVVDKMEESIKDSLQQAEVLRQSILKKAFSGELI